jgi:hypothetical protein
VKNVFFLLAYWRRIIGIFLGEALQSELHAVNAKSASIEGLDGTIAVLAVVNVDVLGELHEGVALRSDLGHLVPDRRVAEVDVGRALNPVEHLLSITLKKYGQILWYCCDGFGGTWKEVDAAVRERQIGPLVDVDTLLIPDSHGIGHLRVVEFARQDQLRLRTGLGRIEDRGLGVASAHLTAASERATARTILVDEVQLAKTVTLELDVDSGKDGLAIALYTLRNVSGAGDGCARGAGGRRRLKEVREGFYRDL